MDFGAKVRTEIVRMGVETVRKAYLVMDGSIGLRNIHEERFRGLVAAELDSYHASQHLHAFADAFPGADRGTWLRTLLDGLKKDGFSPLDAALAAAESALPPPKTAAAAIVREIVCFRKHCGHMADDEAAAGSMPIGSGTVESQYSRFQNRFKRRGPF